MGQEDTDESMAMRAWAHEDWMNPSPFMMSPSPFMMSSGHFVMSPTKWGISWTSEQVVWTNILYFLKGLGLIMKSLGLIVKSLGLNVKTLGFIVKSLGPQFLHDESQPFMMSPRPLRKYSIFVQTICTDDYDYISWLWLLSFNNSTNSISNRKHYI